MKKDVKKITDNKTFWKTIKPFQSYKILSTERITLIDNGEVVPTEQESALVLNTFFYNIGTNLSDPRLYLKIIVRYRNHPSILTIGEVYNRSQKFSFSILQA